MKSLIWKFTTGLNLNLNTMYDINTFNGLINITQK